MRVTQSSGICLGFALLALGCSTIEISTDYHRNTDFASLKTFAWIPEPQKTTGDPRLDNSLLDQRIRKAVDAQLQFKGYEKQPAPPADFFIAYHLSIESKIDVSVVNGYGGVGWGRYWGGGIGYTSVTEWDQGSIVLDFLEPKTRNLIWRGVARAEIYFDSTPEEREERTNKAIRKILERFPPPSNPGAAIGP
ncbi:DUF4136 domain-containing protein [bacterium]|nr:DUF4136 domain-containing protein [bacterium]